MSALEPSLILSNERSLQHWKLKKKKKKKKKRGFGFRGMPVIPTQATIWADKIKTYVHTAKRMGSFKADH